MDIELIKAERPDTPEEEADYWYGMYRQIMDRLNQFHVGSPTALETLDRIIPELIELRKEKQSENVTMYMKEVEKVYIVEVRYNDDNGWQHEGKISEKDIDRAERHLDSELPYVRIPLITGSLHLNRIDFWAVRFSESK